MTPDRRGHEWENDAGWPVCRLCGEVAGTIAAQYACDGSAAEPANVEADATQSLTSR